MKLSAIFAGVFALASLAVSVQSYTNPITIKGYKMYDAKTGKYFSAKGIDYYPRPNTGTLDVNNVDFFTDDYVNVWSKDIEYLAATGANAVRLYAVDPSKSHDAFMCALRSHGMYALIDLGASCEGCSISKSQYPACYSTTLKERGEFIISAFAKYDNVLAFSAGNEVNHVVTDDVTTNAPCQKKFIRDMRSFISGCWKTMRPIPVGVVLADHQREENAKYYSCRTNSTDTLENAEWYGLNAYQYCDPQVTEVQDATGFVQMVTDFKAYKMPIPVILTEFGCLNVGFPTVDGYAAQRNWLQAGWLHTAQFREVFSGGFAFEYSTENANSNTDSSYPFTSYGPGNYGLGYFSPENCNHGTVPCVYNPMPNYKNLATQYNSTDTSAEVAMSAFTPATDRVSPPTCPSIFATLANVTWPVDTVASRACPATAPSFTCPSQVSSGTWVGTDPSGSGTSNPTTTTPSATTTTPSATTTTPTTGSGTATNSTYATKDSGSSTLNAALATSIVTTCMASAIGAAFT